MVTVLSALHYIIKQGVEMNAVVEKLETAVTKMGETVGAVVVGLAELKDALDRAVVANDMALVSAVADKIDVMRKGLANAAAAVDITPETPVPGADVVVELPADEVAASGTVA
jgi:division protein CdvB (Snf7/Vps24/ESCRT-III family)